jgi:rubrerythrin
MFMAIEEGRCPTCNVVGNRMQADKDIMVCPSCKAVFGEFGIVIDTQNAQEHQVA